MPDYSSLNTQIEGFKTELTALYASAQLTGADLLYIAKSLTEISNMLGVNDIVAATASSVATINAEEATSISAITTSKNSAMAQVSSLADNLNTIDVVLLMDAY
jgi:ribosomal protein S5